MKKERSLLLYATIVTVAAMVFLIGCKGKEGPTEPTVTAFETLTIYMNENSMDLPDVLSGWIINDSTLAADSADYYVIDIRKKKDFDNLGHIEGAVNSSLGDILTDAAGSGGKTILVACYTGQSAAHALVGLRLSGYPDAKILKFGMSSWDTLFDKWTSNISDTAVGHAKWTTDPTATPEDFSYPEIHTFATDGAVILKERVDAMLSGGFKGINAGAVLGAPEDYFINNYWAQADVDKYGHIAGAYRIKEELKLGGDGFKHLDPGKTVITYCWTGQTSSVVTAYLTVLGYDAKSLKFGANGMIYSELEAHKWSESGNHHHVKTQ